MTGIVVGLGLVFTLIAVVAVPFTSLNISRDFVGFWAAGHQLAHHASPYDPQAIVALEASIGCRKGTMLPLFNPPWVLPLLYPFGWLGVESAGFLWNVLFLGCALLSVYILRIMHGSPPNYIHWLSFAFTPLILALATGQLSVLALLGFVLFLRFHRSRPLVSGAALWLCALKPHLFLPFAATLLVWIVATRSYKVLAGAVGALAATTAAAYFLEPHAWSEYFHALQFSGLKATFSPCLADALRHWIDPQAVWLRFLPAAAGCVWALIHFWKRRSSWDWARDGNLLILVGLIVAPYGWTYDQCCALPAILEGAYGARSRSLLTVLALLIVLTDLQLCMIASVSPLISPLWLWTAPAWLAWYLIARSRPDPSNLTRA
ncbi:MAG: glycosyltransferase family 87 protein [Terracidiphilus sp.]